MDKPRILIIDDDPGLRKTLSKILSAKGYETIEAKDGAEGFALLAENTINIVLVDLGLPDISGIDVLNRVKVDHPATETIILTGNATLGSAIAATNQGAFSYLLKPYDIDQLHLVIQRAIAKQADEKAITRHSMDLQKINAELQTLYDISKALSCTLEPDKLLSEVLNTFAKMKFLPFEFKGAIFVVEGARVRLISFVNLSESVQESCKDLRIGECLCGLAAESGEIVISTCSHEDERHSLCHSAEPHGHIILPLKSAGKIVGVLNLYLQRDVEIDEKTRNLLLSIGNQIGPVFENTSLFEEAKRASLHDPLTGLANRRFMELQLEKFTELAKRYGNQVSVIMLDIDHFKRYTDAHGHAEGDRLLVKIAGILLKELRTADHVFRYGGEEFLTILPETGLTNACDVAERLRKTVEAELGITISLGVASYQASRDDKVSLMRRADEALYRAKQNGRNRVEAESP